MDIPCLEEVLQCSFSKQVHFNIGIPQFTSHGTGFVQNLIFRKVCVLQHGLAAWVKIRNPNGNCRNSTKIYSSFFLVCKRDL